MYYPFGDRRNSQGNLGTDRLFTGQRLDGSGLYYYGARYYDAEIGRFISADTIVPQPANPQAFNRYSYVLNNPLKYIDPTGHQVIVVGQAVIAPIFTEGLERFDPVRHESYASVFEGTDNGGHIVVLARDRETGAIIPVAPNSDNPNPYGMASAPDYLLGPSAAPAEPEPSLPSGPQAGVATPTPQPPKPGGIQTNTGPLTHAVGAEPDYPNTNVNWGKVATGGLTIAGGFFVGGLGLFITATGIGELAASVALGPAAPITGIIGLHTTATGLAMMGVGLGTIGIGVWLVREGFVNP